MTSTYAVGLWFEEAGLSKIKIDAAFTIFKLVSIFTISSIPFWVQFNKASDPITNLNVNSTMMNNSTMMGYYVQVQGYNDIANANFESRLGGLWGYYLATYLIMAYFMVKPAFQKVADVSSHQAYFVSKGLTIDTTESTTLDQLLQSIEIEKEEFLTEALSIDNFLIAMEDKGHFKINLPFFKSIIATRPFEIVTTYLLKHYYINNTHWTYKNAQENAAAFSALARRLGFLLIPFIPVLLIYSTINHIVTYINNREFLASHDWNRLGIWKFRYYNEFLILARRRLDKTKEAAESVVTDLYLENWKSSISKAFSFLFSLISLFLFIFSFNGYDKLWGMDILPILALFAGLSAILFPRKKILDNRMLVLKELKHDITRKEVAQYFESKISILVKEIISILFLPFLLIWVIPNHSYFISTFMSNFNKDNICTFANWENKHQTEKTKASYDHISFTNVDDSRLFPV